MSCLLRTLRHRLRVGFQRTACSHPVRPQHLQVFLSLTQDCLPSTSFSHGKWLEMDTMQQKIKQYLDLTPVLCNIDSV